MKCAVNSTSLHETIKNWGFAFKGKSTLPITQHLLMEANDSGSLRLAATNFNIWIEATIPATVEEAGKTAVSFRELKLLLNNVGTEELTFEAPNELELYGKMSVKFGNALYKLPILPADEFPIPADDFKGNKEALLNGAALADAIRKTAPFADKRKPTIALSGIHFRKDPKDDALYVVATDAYRLSCVKISDAYIPPMEVTLPCDICSGLAPILAKEAEISWRTEKNNKMIQLQGNNWMAYITAIADKYPNFKNILEQGTLYWMEVEIEEMLPVLKRLGNATKEAPVTLAPQETKLQLIAARSPEEILGKEQVDLVWIIKPNETFSICFNYRFIFDFLLLAQQGTLQIGFTSPTKQVVMKIKDEEDSWVYIAMPRILKEI